MREKVVSLAEAAALIPSGATVCLGGAGSRRVPTAIVFELVRQRRKELHMITPGTGIAVDVLVAAGCVSRIETMYTGLGDYGLARSVRRAAEEGKLPIEDWTESTMSNRFRAAAYGQPYFVTRAFLGSDHPRYSENIRAVHSPFSGEVVHAVRAARSDVTILHGYCADKYGNVQWPARRNPDDFDQEIAQASTSLIVSVERIVSREQVIRNPMLTYIPGRWVTAVTEAPFGAHPGACDGYYNCDHEVLSEYAKMAANSKSTEEWLQRYVYDVRDHYDYLDRIGGLRRLMGLTMRGTEDATGEQY